MYSKVTAGESECNSPQGCGEDPTEYKTLRFFSNVETLPQDKKCQCGKQKKY